MIKKIYTEKIYLAQGQFFATWTSIKEADEKCRDHRWCIDFLEIRDKIYFLGSLPNYLTCTKCEKKKPSQKHLKYFEYVVRFYSEKDY